MNVDAARRLRLVGLGRVNDGHSLGTTTLVVDDGATRLLAGAAVLARLAIGHVVVELKIAVELGLHKDGAERELVNLGTAGEGRRRVLVRTTDAADLLATGVAAATAVAASESLPAEVIVLGE